MNDIEKRHDLTPEEKAQQESFKLQFDVYKHITTLSSGTIVLIATFTEKLFKNAKAAYLIPISAGCFFLSIVLSLFMMAHLAIAMQLFRQVSAFDKRVQSSLYFLSPITFILGIAWLVVLIALNLRSQ